MEKFDFKNPPVIELWIALDVEPNPDGLPWNPGTAEEFFSHIDDAYTDAELEHSHSVKVTKSRNGFPRVTGERVELERVKMFDAKRTRCVQAGGSRIVFNSLMAGSEYPGYEKVYGEAESVFSEYIDYFKPLRIREATLCYIDVINIPLPEGATSIELSEYFVLCRDLPEDPFGPMYQYGVQAVFKCPEDLGPMAVTLRSIPGQPGQKYVRMMMEWQKRCLEVDTLEIKVVRERLKASKDYIWKCFKESFTAQAWNLFEPANTIK